MREKFKQAIDDSEYNVKALASMIDTHWSNVYNHINGRSNFVYGRAQKAAEILDIAIEDVYK